MSDDIKLSIIIPVFNEETYILRILEKIQEVNFGVKKEIIIVDDASEDNTKNLLQQLNSEEYKIIYSEKNCGKGASVAKGLKIATGDIVVIQDADLEYNPIDLPKLMQPILNNECKVVYGSRFLGKNTFMYKQYFANCFLSFLTNFIYGSNLTDMETCYKMFKKEALSGIEIKSKKFDMEPEITSKILKKGIKIKELPITYEYRNYKDGKKINYKDGLKAIFTLLKFRFKD